MKKPGYRTLSLSLVYAALQLSLSACGGGSELTNDNPLATTDQLAAEQLAIQVVNSPAVVQAKTAMVQQWLASAQAVGGVSSESQSRVQEAVDETAMSSALGVINNDPAHPKVVSILAAPHSWGGMNVPGSRTTFDNPDTIYRTIPVDPAASYVIHGHRYPHAPVDMNLSLWDSNNATISNLTASDIVTDANGDYTITVNAAASDGSANHIQLTAQAKEIFVRHTIDEWGTQQFDRLSVERVAGPAVGAALTTAQLIAKTAASLSTGATPFTYYNNLAYAQAVNTLPAITYGGANGRLATQIGTYSALNVADDEALVLTVNLGGAKYFIAPVYARWLITTDYVNHTQTLNNQQAVPNPDGTYTFVISPTDPHVYNWIDTVGIHEGLLNLRWQGLPSTASASAPSATLKLVKLADLKGQLPATTRFVTSDERTAQIAARVNSYASRYLY